MPSIANPLLTVVESVLAWRADPTDQRREQASAALESAISTIGLRGALLVAAGSRPPGDRIGAGSLASRSLPTSNGIELRTDDGMTRTGTLWVDGGATDIGSIVRAVELALAAAWSRDEMRQTAERLEALDAATRGIAGVLSLDRVLQLIADRVRELIGAQYAALGTVDDFGTIERFVTSGISREQRASIGPLPRGHGLLGLIIRENRSYRIPDLGQDADSVGFPANHPPMTSFLGVPIQVKGRSVGNFYLTNKAAAEEFSPADQRLVELFALHAGVAIENARLHEQVQNLAVVDERVRIGKDLHDGIIQALYGVALSLEDVPEFMRNEPVEAEARIDRAIDSLNATIRDIRSFILGLRPELMAQGDIAAGLTHLANEFELNTIIDLELGVRDPMPHLDPETRTEVLQMVRESLSNVARHSGATRASLSLDVESGMATVIVADNGHGFDPFAVPGVDHQGLANMRTRAAQLGGTLDVASAPGKGTRVLLRFPLEPPTPA